MPHFRKKPVVIEAQRVSTLLMYAENDWTSLPGWFLEANEKGDVLILPTEIRVGTLEGRMTASANDWLIRGVKGEIYPCKPEIFLATYDLVDACDAAADGLPLDHTM